MTPDAKTLAQIEEFAGLQFPPAEIAIAVEVAVETFTGGDKTATDAYNRGRLQAEAGVRKALLAMAKHGSSPAQKLLLDLIERNNAAAEEEAHGAQSVGMEGDVARSALIEDQHLADLVAAIEAHIEPLKLSDSLTDTDPDLVRLAAEEIKALRREVKRLERQAKRPAKKKGVSQSTQRTRSKKTKSKKTVKSKKKTPRGAV